MILLVEDSEDDVFLFTRAMMKAHVSLPVYNARDGQEALDYLQAAGKFRDRQAFPLPSLIFLDLKIPLVHGFEVLRWVRSQPAFNHTPVVMLTASLEDKDRGRALQMGADEYMIKPPTQESLSKAFENGSVKIVPRHKGNPSI